MKTETITFTQLCKELKIDPCEVRERLRATARDPKEYPELEKSHKPRTPWKWAKEPAGEKEILSYSNFSKKVVIGK